MMKIGLNKKLWPYAFSEFEMSFSDIEIDFANYIPSERYFKKYCLLDKEFKSEAI